MNEISDVDVFVTKFSQALDSFKNLYDSYESSLFPASISYSLSVINSHFRYINDSLKDLN